MNKNRVFLLLVILIIVGIITFSILFRIDNVGVSIEGLYVKKGNEKMKISSIINTEDQLFIVFFSYECPACKPLLNNKSIANKFVFINIDYDKSVPFDVFSIASF